MMNSLLNSDRLNGTEVDRGGPSRTEVDRVDAVLPSCGHVEKKRLQSELRVLSERLQRFNSDCRHNVNLHQLEVKNGIIKTLLTVNNSLC